MRIPQKAQAQERYTQLKGLMQKAADKPSNQALFEKTGDRVELNQDVRLKIDGQDTILKSGSAIDNDIKTKDTISTESTVDGVVQHDTFEHFSQRKGLIFKHDQEMMTVSHSDQQGFNRSSNSATFEV